MYEYKAVVVDIYDGDTITVDIDLGFKSGMRGLKLRLFGIDAPEMRGAEKVDGKVTRDWLREQILGQEVRVKTYRDNVGKYGRWLAEVFATGDDADSRSLNQQMVDLGLAQEAHY